MTWTLWRGDDCLGTLHDRSALQPPQAARPDARHVDAVLVPDPAYLPLPSMHQHVKELSGRLAFVGGSVWLVSLMLAPDAPAT
jgi:hypothetical protein